MVADGTQIIVGTFPTLPSAKISIYTCKINWCSCFWYLDFPSLQYFIPVSGAFVIFDTMTNKEK
jgi:hypothetical protein